MALSGAIALLTFYLTAKWHPCFEFSEQKFSQRTVGGFSSPGTLRALRLPGAEIISPKLKIGLQLIEVFN